MANFDDKKMDDIKGYERFLIKCKNGNLFYHKWLN